MVKFDLRVKNNERPASITITVLGMPTQYHNRPSKTICRDLKFSPDGIPEKYMSFSNTPYRLTTQADALEG